MHVLKLENISIEFPGVKALDNVSIEFRSGEIHALVGANGAGKSTLFKIISGVYTHYTGKIYLDGEPLKASSPHDVLKKGIYCIYQEVDTSLVPDLSVAENLMMHIISNTKEYGVFRWKRLYSEARKLIERSGFEDEISDLKAKISEITLAKRQIVAIARAIAADAKFILFDEPTSSLSSEETKKLLKIIRNLKERGIGIVFVSHRLEEVFEVADKISVLRDGKYVGTKEKVKTNHSEIVEMMLGHSLQEQFPIVPHEIHDDVVLEVKNLSYSNKVRDVSFKLRKGEILGIYGLVGAGKTEVLSAIYGSLKPDRGKVVVKGKVVKFKIPRDAVKKGIYLIPEERRKQGLFLQKSIAFNTGIVNLDRISKGSFVLRARERKLAKDVIESLKIVARSTDQMVDYLSGGNQQKVVIGKWIVREGDVFLFDEPTKGIDVGAKSEIYRIISELASKGKSVIFVSPEIPEIMGLCDRVIVMYNGRITARFEKEEMDPQKMLFYATGGIEQ